MPFRKSWPTIAGMVFLSFFLLVAAVFAGHALFRRISDPARRIRIGYGVAAVHTLLYWAWESQAEGSIRVDLVVIYPYLAATYVMYLWPRLQWWSIAVMLALMALNWAFVLAGYMIFDKPVG